MWRRLGVAILTASALALLVLILGRSVGFAFNPWWHPIGVGIVGALSIGWSFVRSVSMDDAARLLDLRLQTKNRFGTARTIERDADAFAELIRRDADRRASGLDLRRAAPIRFGAAAGWAVVCAGVSVAVFVWMPAFDVLGNRQRELARNQLSERVEAARREIEEASSTIESLVDEVENEDSGSEERGGKDDARARETLDRLTEQLARSDASQPEDGSERVDDLIAEASSELESLADDLESEAARDERALDELQDRFAGVTPPESGPTRDFSDLLRQGRFDEAADALRDSIDQADDVEERREIARDLDRLAEQLERSRALAQSKREAEQDALAEQLRRRGLSEDEIEGFLEEPNEDAVREALENAGADPLSVEEDAASVTRKAEDLEARRRADDELEQTARDLSRVADELESEPPAETDDDARDPGESNEVPPAGENESDPPSNAAAESERDRSLGENDPATGDETDGPQESADEEAGETGERATERERSTPTPTEEGTEPKPGTDPNPSDAEPNANEQPQSRDQESDRGNPDADSSRPEDTPSDAGESSATTSGEDATEPRVPTEVSGDESAGEAADGESSEEPPSDQALEEALRRLSERRGDAQRQREVSEELRDRARRLAEQMTPEQREQIERWARQRAAEEERDARSGAAGDPSGSDGESAGPFDPLERPYDLEEVDLRDPDTAMPEDEDYTVLAEWLRDNGREMAPGVDNDAVRSSARRAAEATERALNEESIGPRYRDLIRRWADRLPETLEKASTPVESDGNGSDG